MTSSEPFIIKRIIRIKVEFFKNFRESWSTNLLMTAWPTKKFNSQLKKKKKMKKAILADAHYSSSSTNPYFFQASP
jgi:hypothetical protein